MSVAQKQSESLTAILSFPLHVGFPPQVGRPALDQEVKISTEMEATTIFISDTESSAATLTFLFFFFFSVASLEEGRWKGKRPGMSKIQKKTIK